MLKISLNDKNLSNLLNSIGKMDKDFNNVIKNALNEAGNKVLAKTIVRTPVGQYKDGRVGGTLRQGWELSQARKKKQNIFIASVFNNIEYATFVEKGHFTPNRKRFIDGKYMLAKSVEEVDLQSILMSKVGAVINGNK